MNSWLDLIRTTEHQTLRDHGPVGWAWPPPFRRRSQIGAKLWLFRAEAKAGTLLE